MSEMTKQHWAIYTKYGYLVNPETVREKTVYNEDGSFFLGNQVVLPSYTQDMWGARLFTSQEKTQEFIEEHFVHGEAVHFTAKPR